MLSQGLEDYALAEAAPAAAGWVVERKDARIRTLQPTELQILTTDRLTADVEGQEVRHQATPHH